MSFKARFKECLKTFLVIGSFPTVFFYAVATLSAPIAFIPYLVQVLVSILVLSLVAAIFITLE